MVQIYTWLITIWLEWDNINCIGTWFLEVALHQLVLNPMLLNIYAFLTSWLVGYFQMS